MLPEASRDAKCPGAPGSPVSSVFASNREVESSAFFSSTRQRLSTSVTACAPAGASAARGAVERHSWKNRCVFGFSKMSASAERITGLSAAWHRHAASSSAPTPPSATNRARFLASGTQHRQTARTVAAPNAMGVAASVATKDCVARSNTRTPPARRKTRKFRASPSHRAARREQAARLAGSSATAELFLFDFSDAAAPGASVTRPPRKVSSSSASSASSAKRRPGSNTHSAASTATAEPPMRSASAAENRAARSRNASAAARRPSFFRAFAIGARASPAAAAMAVSTAPAAASASIVTGARRARLRSASVCKSARCASDHRRAIASAAPRAPAWSGKPASGARCASSAATNTPPTSPSVSFAPSSSAASSATSIHARRFISKSRGRAGDAHADGCTRFEACVSCHSGMVAAATATSTTTRVSRNRARHAPPRSASRRAATNSSFRKSLSASPCASRVARASASAKAAKNFSEGRATTVSVSVSVSVSPSRSPTSEMASSTFHSSSAPTKTRRSRKSRPSVGVSRSNAPCDAICAAHAGSRESSVKARSSETANTAASSLPSGPFELGPGPFARASAAERLRKHAGAHPAAKASERRSRVSRAASVDALAARSTSPRGLAKARMASEAATAALTGAPWSAKHSATSASARTTASTWRPASDADRSTNGLA